MKSVKKNSATLRVNKVKNKVIVSNFGLKILKKISDGKALKNLPSGGAKLGSIMVPDNLLNELFSLDLLVKRSASEIVISDAGRSFVRRSKPIEKIGKSSKTQGKNVVEPYKLQHQVPEVVSKLIDGKLVKLNVNLAESPLGWLRRRKNKDGSYLISLEQFEAAERFRADYEFSTNSKSLTSNYDGVPISKGVRSSPGDLNYTDRQLDAKKRYDAALRAVGSGLSDSLLRVCCHLEGFEAAEKALGWPSRSIKLVMVMALDRLVEHYKMSERPTK